MRHKKNINQLGRKSAHRKAMLSNMASSLIMQKRIETTTAKAKALKRYIEPLITRSKNDSTHSRRVVFGYLQDKEAVSELFREVGAKVADRPGGYTRIIRLGHRLGDNADMCMIELVDYNENLLAEKAATRKSAGRRRRGGRSKAEGQKAAARTAAAAEAAAEGEVITEELSGQEEAAAGETPAEEAVEEKPAAEAAGETPAEEVVEEKPAAEADGESAAEEDESGAPAEEDPEEKDGEKRDS
jgi:large subunit ribosomal protein L17